MISSLLRAPNRMEGERLSHKRTIVPTSKQKSERWAPFSDFRLATAYKERKERGYLGIRSTPRERTEYCKQLALQSSTIPVTGAGEASEGDLSWSCFFREEVNTASTVGTRAHRVRTHYGRPDRDR